ncbi:MAG: DNA mismatch repair endonuclease MutL [Prevotellaceae bacterium]|jgi:DNA mismatch repair protein MutL|nr:DNA mismatch repair endonuclease MutL [Prevotellaceae bacterium]
MIRLLPDSVANQIAAGEVVQRPASVVKELMENAIDAGATQIGLIIKDAGKTLIQVKDNGSGMSDRDARMAFERHATSKISEIGDLEYLNTFGFRGEALASIAAVADVELRTRQAGEDLGCRLLISASKITGSEPVQCPEGSTFSVKNLFFNIPARRKFLKSDATELKYIINEFQKIAISNTGVEFTFINNGIEIYNLPCGNLRQRLSGIFGKNTGVSLIDAGAETSIVSITGVIGKPDRAKKSSGEQFFFVNNRYFRSAYFQKAIIRAYEQLLPADSYPSYFLFLSVDPLNIDVNIHPQKTEVKFEEEQAIWQIINAAIRESLSKYMVAPSIIFDMEDAPDIPVIDRNTQVTVPELNIDTNFNPFNIDRKSRTGTMEGWEQLYENFDRQGKHSFDSASLEKENNYEPEQRNIAGTETVKRRFLPVKDKYILTPVKSGIMMVDICRAHQRILFEYFLSMFETNFNIVSQQQLFPEKVELSVSDHMLFHSVCDELNKAGFDIRSFDNNSFIFCAIPAGLEKTNAKTIVDEILLSIKEDYNSRNWDTHEKLALSLAKAESVKRCGNLSDNEMEYLINKLFACKTPDIDGEGKPVIHIISMEDMDRFLLKN